MSTVGYGDYVPSSLAGRIFASLIILLGLCFFAILTANFSSLFVRRYMRRFRTKESQDIERVIKHIDEVESRDEELLSLVKEIKERVKTLEEKE